MKFNIDDYKGKYVMHCKTKEEAIDFRDYLHSIGKTWRSEALYFSLPCWDIYKSDTCYDFNKGESSYKDYYKKNEYTILEWEDFMNKKEFTKADLKSGDIITFRNNQIGLVFAELNGAVFNGLCNQMDLSSINHHLFDVYDSNWDIVKVQRPERIGQTLTKYWGEVPVIWEREEIVEMTLEEVCKALGKEIKIIKSK